LGPANANGIAVREITFCFTTGGRIRHTAQPANEANPRHVSSIFSIGADEGSGAIRPTAHAVWQRGGIDHGQRRCRLPSFRHTVSRKALFREWRAIEAMPNASVMHIMCDADEWVSIMPSCALTIDGEAS